jgi:hypothetical protein
MSTQPIRPSTFTPTASANATSNNPNVAFHLEGSRRVVEPLADLLPDALELTSAVDINIVCHLISAGKREPKIGAHVTLSFLTSIASPPVMAYRIH